MGNLLQDLRFTFRQLRKSPSFTLTAVLTLALGIGANTAIFSLVNSLLLKPLPVASPDQIAVLTSRQNHGPLQRPFSLPEFRAIRDQSRNSFSDVFAVGGGLDGFATGGQKPERITTAYVGGNFFDGLGLQPAAGRLFLRSEGEVLDRDPVMVLAYDFWMQRFNGDPGVVGRQVTVDGHALSIVGVAPKGFHGIPSVVLSVAAYLPLSQATVEGTPADLLNSWQNRSYLIYARLRPGISLGQATAELNIAARNIMRQHPEDEKQIEFQAFSEPSLRVGGGGNPNAIYIISALFLGLASLVLVLACVNVANLVLVRATVREREMAIRSALGARRSRLLRQMITESVTLALIGGGMGVLLGVWAGMALSRVDLHLDIPLSLSIGFDWRIFFYSFGVALVAGMVVGMAPALRAAKANVSAVLHEGSRGVTRGRHWMRDGLVVLQIAGSLVLLVVAGLFVRSLGALQTADFGFKSDRVLNLSFDTSLIGINDAQARVLNAAIQARLHQLAGVSAVSQASEVPMGYFTGNTDTLTIDGAPAPADASALTSGFNVVSPEYFQVMGISLVRGRGFAIGDDERGRDVAVIGQSLAAKFWPNQDPLGHTFRLASEKSRPIEVVGIARDVEVSSVAGKSQPYFYLPYAQHLKGNSFLTLQVRTEGDPLALAATVEKAIHELAPQLPVFQVQSMHQALYSLNGLLLFQFGAALAAMMGGLGLTLAVIGLYGVISYMVGQRVHEIGLRMALGATRGSVFAMIYRQSMRIVGVGLGIGLVLALLVARAVGSFVVVSAWDPVTFLTVLSALVLAALASCYLPARRAMTVEPMVALRQD
jgi:predicted permease